MYVNFPCTEQEKDLLRAFRARLYSVQEELESEKNKTDDGASAWIEKSKQLETEVEWTKELADRLDRLNQSLTRENQRLKTQFTTQENDREFLVKQLVGVKKDNVRLRNEYEALQRELHQLKEEPVLLLNGSSSNANSSLAMGTVLSASTSALPKMSGGNSVSSMTALRPSTAAMPSLATLPDADNRYKEIIKRLKRLLEVERRNLQQVRASYKLELQGRTELEMVLKECIQDVRAEITAHQSQLPLMGNSSYGTAGSRRSLLDIGSSTTNGAIMTTTSAFVDARLSGAERQRLVDKLLVKERLLHLLASKAFPMRRAHPNNSSSSNDPLHSGDAVSPEDVAKIYADVTPPLTG